MYIYFTGTLSSCTRILLFIHFDHCTCNYMFNCSKALFLCIINVYYHNSSISRIKKLYIHLFIFHSLIHVYFLPIFFTLSEERMVRNPPRGPSKADFMHHASGDVRGHRSGRGDVMSRRDDREEEAMEEGEEYSGWQPPKGKPWASCKITQLQATCYYYLRTFRTGKIAVLTPHLVPPVRPGYFWFRTQNFESSLTPLLVPPKRRYCFRFRTQLFKKWANPANSTVLFDPI